MKINEPILLMLCGLPGSGKSTYAKDLSDGLENVVICSSDDIRKELFRSDDNEVNTKENNQKVFQELHKRVKELLVNKVNVIYDATNINSRCRKDFLDELKYIPCYKKCIIIATKYEKCLERNKSRDRVVPEEVIKRMYLNWQTPYYFEGWDDIGVRYLNNDSYMSVYSFLHENMFYDQHNSHHANSLGVHSILTGDWNLHNSLLRCAGYLHDCGKPFVQSFTDKDGNITEQAHYYQHHCVGAYNTLFFDTEKEFRVRPLDVSVLVNYHMYPYFWDADKENGDKTREKYRKLWGNELYTNIMKLYDADRLTH